MPVPFIVKEERDDEAEIVELAKKFREANRAKLAQTAIFQNSQPVITGPLNMARAGQPTIGQYFNGNAKEGAAVTNGGTAPVKPVQEGSDEPVDEESKKGRFGWFDIEKQFLPYIFR